MANLEKLKSIINISSLASEDKEEIISVLSQISDEKLAIVIEVCEKKPEWVEKISNNIKTKKQALTNKDSMAWGKIMANEELELLKIEEEEKKDIDIDLVKKQIQELDN